MPYFLAPDPAQGTFLIPGTNTPGSGVQLFTYETGTTTKVTTYLDNAGAASHTNPIVLDSGGNLPSASVIWLLGGQSYRFVWAPSNDTDPPASAYRTIDNIDGINDVGIAQSLQWISGPAPIFVGGTQLTLSGDQTTNAHTGRRIQTENTAGTIYSTITSSVFSASTTAVGVANDSGSLDAGISSLSYGLLTATNPSVGPVHIYRKGANVSSSADGTTNIWAVTGDFCHITGTNTIYSFSSAPYAGAMKEVFMDSTAVLIYSAATMQLPTANNVSTRTGDRFRVRADTVSTHVIMEYARVGGVPVVSTQASGTVFAGPSTGAGAVPAFRALSGFDGASAVLIAATSAASTLNIDFTNPSVSSYTVLKLFASNVFPTSDNVTFNFRFFATSSEIASTTNYQWGYQEVKAGNAGTASSFAHVSFSSANFISAMVGSGASTVSEVFGTEITIYNPGITNRYKPIRFFSSAQNEQEFFAIYDGGGVWQSTAAIAGVRLFMSSGSTATGDFALYGIRNQ